MTLDGYSNLLKKNNPIDSTILGKMKVEHSLSFFHCLAPKFYMMCDYDHPDHLESKSKGINTKNIENSPEKITSFFLAAIKPEKENG